MRCGCARGSRAELFTERTGLEIELIGAPLALAIERGLVLGTASGYRPSALGLRFLNEALLLFMAEKPQMTGESALSIARPGSGGRQLRGFIHRAQQAQPKNE